MSQTAPKTQHRGFAQTAPRPGPHLVSCFPQEGIWKTAIHKILTAQQPKGVSAGVNLIVGSESYSVTSEDQMSLTNVGECCKYHAK
jgi:hypothetical protein